MERIKAVYGCPGREVEILEWLKNQGATKEIFCNAFLSDPDRVFFVLDGLIRSLSYDTLTVNLLEIVDLPRWRAERAKLYYYVGCDGTINQTFDSRDSLDNKLYEIGNYFKTREDVEAYVKKFYDLFKENIK